MSRAPLLHIVRNELHRCGNTQPGDVTHVLGRQYDAKGVGANFAHCPECLTNAARESQPAPPPKPGLRHTHVLLQYDAAADSFYIVNDGVPYDVVLAVTDMTAKVVGICCPSCEQWWELDELDRASGKCVCGLQFPGQ